MIPIPAGTQVWLAAGHTDMRNYAVSLIMRILINNVPNL